MTNDEDTKKIKFYKIKYKNKRILLGYCDFENFKWNCVKIKGATILTISNNYSLEYKRKILHKVISELF